MQSQNRPPSPQRQQQRPQPLQQAENLGRTKLPAGIMMLSPKEAVSSPRPVLGQLGNANTARAFTSSDEDSSSYSNSQFSGTTKSKNSFGVPEASPSPDKLWRIPATSSTASSHHASPEFNHYRSRMQTSPSGYPSPTDTDMYMDEENSSVSSVTPMEAPTDMYTFATAAASILQQAREEEEEEEAQSVSDASSAASADAIPPKNYMSPAPMPNWTNRNDGSVMDSYRNTILGTPPAPTMMSQTDKYGNDLNPLSPFRADYTYSESEDESVVVDVPPDSATHHTPIYGYSPEVPTAPTPELPSDQDETPVRKNISPYLPTVSPYRPGSRETPPDESAIDWQNYNDSTSSPPRGLPSMLGDADSCDLSGAELESPARFLRSTREETLGDVMETPKAEGTPDEEEPTQVEYPAKHSSPDAKMEQSNPETPDVKESSKETAPNLNEFYSKPGLMSPGEKSVVFSLDDCKTLAKQAETPGAKSIEFSLDVCQADPELAMKPFLLQQSNSADSTIPDDADEDGMFKPTVATKGGAASKGIKARVAAKKKKKNRGDKEASSIPSNGADGQSESDQEKPEKSCCNFSLRCKLFGLLFLALLVFVPIIIGKLREKASTSGDLLSEETSDFPATDFPTEAPTVQRSTSKRPTNKGTREPSQSPVSSPSSGVTLNPTLPTVETKAPTLTPVADTTLPPAVTQTQAPTKRQTGVPTLVSTDRPTSVPTQTTTDRQTGVPTETATDRQTGVPTQSTTARPTNVPTQSPSKRPTNVPTVAPVASPTQVPSKRPTNVPTLASSNVPTQAPTIRNTNLPSLSPSVRATESPTRRQTDTPTSAPSVAQTRRPTTASGAPVGRPSRPITDGNAPIGRPSLGGRPTVVDAVPTLSPIWSGLLTGDAMDDTNLDETHWPQYDTKTGLRLEILSALESQWQPSLDATVNDWNTFESVELTITNAPPEEECEPVWGKIKICNHDFGETNWRSSIEVYFRSVDIVAVSLRVNDFYTLDQGWAQYTLCHQLGHAIGLGNTLELNCMRYVSLYSDSVSIQLQSPDPLIGELLYDAYGPISDGQRRLKDMSERKMDGAEHFDSVIRYTV